MNLTIENIILFPKKEKLEPRHIHFSSNKVNIITGDSHKGKSAIIHILDYCLGSYKCTIPVDTIRDTTAIFAIHLKLQNSEIFLGREEPGVNETTSEMYLFEDSSIKLNSLLNLNNHRERFEKIKVNRKTVIERLNHIAGFSSQRFSDEDDDSKNQWLEAASFRDTSAFQFQPQNIVANPTTLFYKTDTYEHQNKLRTIFPLLLGYETNEIISLRKQKKDLESKLNLKTNQLKEKKKAREVWKGEVFNHYDRALDLGLTNKILDYDASKVDDVVYELENILHYLSSNPLPSIKKESSSRFSKVIEKLIQERNELGSTIDHKKFTLAKILEFNTAQQEFGEKAISKKRQRLKPIEWFLKNETNNRCPFCESENDKALDQLLSLNEESMRLDFFDHRASMDKEISIKKKELQKLEESFNRINQQLNQFFSEQEKENTKRYQIEEIYRFLGKLEEALDNVNKSSIDGALQNEIDKLGEDILEIDNKLEKELSVLSKDKAIQNITLAISKYTETLDIERKNDPVILDPKNLTIQILNQSKNRKDFFWEVGSGANHLGYHIATLLGLHEYFLNLKNLNLKNYVPSFIIFDQPSQVYFPKSIPELPEDIKNLEGKTGDDFRNTMKIFETCSNFIKRTKGNTQIIILEHAPEIAWAGLNNINLVEEWRNDESNENALIPRDWLM